jgi:group I intron endonuclease
MINSGIYKITNTLTNKVYIGSSTNISNREYKHFWMLKKNIHDNEYLQKSFNKYGDIFFNFEIIEYCQYNELIEKENFYITSYNSNNSNYGYNLASVNEFRRNTYNSEVKIKLSKYNLNKNGNINKFLLTNILTDESFMFDNLVDGANYLIQNGYAKGNPRNVRQKLSSSLRMKKMNNGSNGSIRKTCYKHTFKTIN